MTTTTTTSATGHSAAVYANSTETDPPKAEAPKPSGTPDVPAPAENPPLNPKPTLSMPTVGTGDIPTLLAELQLTLQNTMQELTQARLQANRVEMQERSNERIDKLKKAAEEMSKSNFWQDVATYASWAPYVLGAVGVLMCATGVGAPVGAVLIAGAAIAFAMTGLAEGMKAIGADKFITEKILEPAFTWLFQQGKTSAEAITNFFVDLGMDEKTAKWVTGAMVAAVCIAAAVGLTMGGGAVFGVVGGIAGGVAGAAVVSAGVGGALLQGSSEDDIKNAAKMTAELTYGLLLALPAIVAGMGTGNLITALSGMQKLMLAFAQAIPQLANAWGQIEQGKINRDVAEHQADAMTLQASIQQLQKKIEEQLQQLEELMEAWQRSIEAAMGMFNTEQQIFKKIVSV